MVGTRVSGTNLESENTKDRMSDNAAAVVRSIPGLIIYVGVITSLAYS